MNLLNQRLILCSAGGTFKVGSVTMNNTGVYYSTPSVSFSGGGGSGAAGTANMGTVNNPGAVTAVYPNQTSGWYTLSSAAPTISFSPSGAAATANFGTGQFVYLSYTTTARTTSQTGAISFSGGGGSGAAANYTGSVARYYWTPAFTISSGGSGYTVAPTIQWTSYGGSTILAYPSTTVNISGGQVVSVTVNSAGDSIVDQFFDFGYALPSASLVGGNGSGATLGYTSFPSIIDVDYWVYGVSGGLSNIVRGSGYTSTPTATVPNTVTGTVVPLFGKQVTSATVTSGGSYYSAPTVTFSGGTDLGFGGIGFNSSVDGTWSSYYYVASVTVTNQGTGYTTAPTVVFSPASATATANMIPE